MIQKLAPLRFFRKQKGYSEREACKKAALSRLTLRNAEAFYSNLTLKSIYQYLNALELNMTISIYQTDGNPECSSIATCLKVNRDGFDTWKIHYMDFVDEFRRTLDTRLLILEPPKNYPLKLKALFASIVLDLCSDYEIIAPWWAKKDYFLKEPWFLSGTESLKASALVESPVFYKKNNIFVLENFLKRA